MNRTNCNSPGGQHGHGRFFVRDWDFLFPAPRPGWLARCGMGKGCKGAGGFTAGQGRHGWPDFEIALRPVSRIIHAALNFVLSTNCRMRRMRLMKTNRAVRCTVAGLILLAQVGLCPAAQVLVDLSANYNDPSPYTADNSPSAVTQAAPASRSMTSSMRSLARRASAASPASCMASRSRRGPCCSWRACTRSFSTVAAFADSPALKRSST